MFLRNEGYWSIVGLLCEWMGGSLPLPHTAYGAYRIDICSSSRAEGTLHLSRSDDVACLRHALDGLESSSPTLRMG